VVNSPQTHVFFREVRTPGASQHCSATLDDSTDVASPELHKAAIAKAEESFTDTEYFPTKIERAPGHRSNGGIHSRRIASAS
jgi:hypothetical protein